MIPKPLFDTNPVAKIKPLFTDVQVTPVIKPKALFADEGFKATDIDVNVRTTSVQYGKFSDIELARITHIMHHDLSGALSNEASIFQHIEKMQIATKRSNEILTAALSSTVISDINEAMRSILGIITGTYDLAKPVLYNVLHSVARMLNPVGNPVIPASNEQGNETIKQLVTNLTNTSIPIANKVVAQLKDAVYYAKNDRKQLQLYFIAGKLRCDQLTVASNLTANDQSYDQVDRVHALNLFSRRIDNIHSHIQAISVSILQAQTVCNTLENMLLDVSSTVLISVPSYLQQVAFMGTIRDLKNAAVLQEFEKHRSTAINDLKQLLKTSKG